MEPNRDPAQPLLALDDVFRSRLVAWRVLAFAWGAVYLMALQWLVEMAMMRIGIRAQKPLVVAVSSLAVLHLVTIGAWYTHILQPATRTSMRPVVAALHAVGIGASALLASLQVGPIELWGTSVVMLVIYLIGVTIALARPVPSAAPFARAVDDVDRGDQHHGMPKTIPAPTSSTGALDRRQL